VGASDHGPLCPIVCCQGCERVSHWWQWLLQTASTTLRLAATGDVWSVRRVPSEGVMSLFSLRAINRGVSRPWLRLSTYGDFVSILESAWEPSNSLGIDSVHLIE
jgi:hypothetical protein